MKKKILVTALLAALGHIPSASAVNWLQLQNSEAAGAEAFRYFGFIQPTYTYNQGGAVTGIPSTVVSPVNGANVAVPAGLTAYNGQTALPNLVGPELKSRSQFQVLRARIGARGVLPESDEKINYFVLAEVGDNGLTRTQSAVMSDANMTFNHIPGMRVRAGLGRLPMGEEAMMGVQVMDYINFTNVTDQLLNERFVEPYANAARTHAAAPGVPMAMSKIVGPVGGYRDVGVQLFDWFTDGRWEYAYALMLSQGNGISFNTDHPDNHDVTTRLQASYVLQGAGQKREDIIAYVWNQTGNRVYAGNDNKRVREGVGARYAHHGVRLAGEYIRARGMIYVAPTPQFNDIGAPAYEPIDYVALDSNNTAAGYYLDAGWRFVQDWEADVRYDVLNKMTNSAYDERRATTWTFGAQYFYSPKLRVVMNYEMRKVEVTNPDAQVTNAQKIQGTAATVIGDSVGNRISAQLTYIF